MGDDNTHSGAPCLGERVWTTSGRGEASESHNQLRNTRHPLSLALLEAPHGQIGRQIGHDTTLQRTPSHDGPRKGAHNHCQHDATWTAPPRSTRFLRPHTTTSQPDHIHGNGLRRNRKNENKIFETEATSPRPTSSTTKPQSSPSSAGDDTQ